MMFLVDSDGDGVTDHFVPVLGYDDRGTGGKWYGLYTTWSEAETVVWEPFHAMTSGSAWGIGYATFDIPLDPPIPEPGTLLLFSSGLIGAVGFIRRKIAV